MCIYIYTSQCVSVSRNTAHKLHIDIHTYTHMYMCIYIYVYSHIDIQNMYIYIYNFEAHNPDDGALVGQLKARGGYLCYESKGARPKSSQFTGPCMVLV